MKVDERHRNPEIKRSKAKKPWKWARNYNDFPSTSELVDFQRSRSSGYERGGGAQSKDPNKSRSSWAAAMTWHRFAAVCEAALLCVMFEPGRPDRCRLTRPCVVRSVNERYTISSCTSSTKNGRDFPELVDERELNAAGLCINTHFVVSSLRPAPAYPAEPPPSPGSIPPIKHPVRAL